MVSLVSRVYQGLFKRTSTFALTIIVGAFFFERAVDVGCDYVFDKINEGTIRQKKLLQIMQHFFPFTRKKAGADYIQENTKQWKDIKHRYVQD